MNYEYKSSFDRTFKKMQTIRKKKAIDAISQLIDFFETSTKAQGLGLKNLKDIFWEIRFSLKDRIIFSVENNEVSFI
jgi:hypothetical protein